MSREHVKSAELNDLLLNPTIAMQWNPILKMSVSILQMMCVISKLTSFLQLPKESIDKCQRLVDQFIGVLRKHGLHIDVGTWQLTPSTTKGACHFEGDTATGRKEPVC